MTDVTRRPPIGSRISGWLVDLVAVGSVGMIVYGVGLVYAPAEWIVAGGFGLAAAWLVARKGGA